MSRALVIGGSGFAGRHVVDQLVESGQEVTATYLRTPLSLPEVDVRCVDVTDGKAIVQLVRDVDPDVVFHLAALVDTVVTPDILRLYAINVLGTASVVEAMRVTGSAARLVFASSAFVYGQVDP